MNVFTVAMACLGNLMCLRPLTRAQYKVYDVSILPPTK